MPTRVSLPARPIKPLNRLAVSMMGTVRLLLVRVIQGATAFRSIEVWIAYRKPTPPVRSNWNGLQFALDLRKTLRTFLRCQLSKPYQKSPSWKQAKRRFQSQPIVAHKELSQKPVFPADTLGLV